VTEQAAGMSTESLPKIDCRRPTHLQTKLNQLFYSLRKNQNPLYILNNDMGTEALGLCP